MCDHKNVFSIGGKTSDMCYWTFPNGITDDGYVPSWSGIGTWGDYLDIEVCLDCKTLLNIDVEGILSEMNDSNGENDYD